jgi:agmatine deiminase
MKVELGTPKRDGFHMPAEFEWHDSCWMLWPDNGETFRMGGIPAQAVFTKVAKAISKYEKVTICVNREEFSNALNAFSDTSIRVIEMSSNDAWMRDVGPTFVVDTQKNVRGIDWAFNAYGGLIDGLYFPWDLDNLVAQKVCSVAGYPIYTLPHIVMEGGSYQTDGEGTVIVTEECLLSEGRNPNLNKEKIETILNEFLGTDKVIWLKRGLFLDETNGHIDNLLCFVRPAEVLLAWTDDPDSLQYDVVRSSLSTLENTTDAKGREFVVHKIPLPAEIIMTQEESDGLKHNSMCFKRCPGDRFAASYTNLYIANGAVIFPTFNDPHDEEVKKLYEEIFDKRKIIGVYSRELFLGGGGIHSITLSSSEAIYK